VEELLRGSSFFWFIEVTGSLVEYGKEVIMNGNSKKAETGVT
jgi:hypothetical protein